MSEIASVRRMYAQQIVAAASATTPGLLDAFAAIPREQFLGPGPWVVVGAGDPKPRRTPDADPSHVYADVSVAIAAERQLFNGQPSFLARMIDSLALAPGRRVVHIGEDDAVDQDGVERVDGPHADRQGVGLQAGAEEIGGEGNAREADGVAGEDSEDEGEPAADQRAPDPGHAVAAPALRAADRAAS